MSRLPFELLLAFRYLRPKRTFVSVITLISVTGVTLGVAVLVIVISVMSGFDKEMREKILGFNTHLRVEMAGEETLTNYSALMRLVSSNRSVKAVAPYVQGQVLVKTQPEHGKPRAGAPWLRGIDPKVEAQMSTLPTNIVKGEFDLGHAGLLVGTEFARAMRIGIGDRVLVYSPETLAEMEKNRDKESAVLKLPDEFEIRGIFDVGYFDYNVSFVVASLEDAKELYTLGNSVHGLLVVLKDPYQAKRVQMELEKALGPGFQIHTWMEDNAKLLGALVVEKNVMFYLLFFIMIVAALCILSALITFVVQKTREIGVLKALGATDVQVFGLFLSQSGFVGTLGVAAGFGLGMLALAYRNEFLHFMRYTFNFELFPPEIYEFSELPALIVPKEMVFICGSALLVCLMGGVIPALRAGRLAPLDALRHE
jgi:lipoprotein-releasing system permease protein